MKKGAFLQGHITDFTVLAVLQVLLACAGFLMRLKLANAIGRADFGEFVTASALGSVAAIICHFGMDKSLIGEFTRRPGCEGGLLAASLKLKTPLFLVCVFGISLFWGYYSDSRNRVACAAITAAALLQVYSLQ